MIPFLLRILIFLLALWLLRRFLGSLMGEPLRKPPRRPEEERGGSGAKMVRDPVCGMYMDPRLAVRVENKQGTFYFCSEECRRKYLA